MDEPTVRRALSSVSAERIRRDLFYLSKDPLPYRKASYVRSGRSDSTLAEADAYIANQLEAAGLQVQTTEHQVQAFRCDESKPIHHWYATPAASDPWYTVKNILATVPGRSDEVIYLVAHKDSMSWIDSPGAHDNCSGTVAALEIARVLAAVASGGAHPGSASPEFNDRSRRSVRVLFCNEEHTPWTSRFAAEAASSAGEQVAEVHNLDSLDGKSDEERQVGCLTHTVVYSTDEGKSLAEQVRETCRRYEIPVDFAIAAKGHINDDDGMFINAGFRRTVLHIGSWPYADLEYHLPGDVPERVNIENLLASTRLVLAHILGARAW